MKKIYFACSIRGGRDDAEIYAEIVKSLKTKAELLTEVFADGKLTSMGMNKPSYEIHKTDITWIKEADAVIAEVTNPSLGVGYEIAKAEEWGKPVLCLYRSSPDKKLSAMIEGSPGVHVVEYQTLHELDKPVAKFISSLH